MASGSHRPIPVQAATPAAVGGLGSPALWQADPARAVVSIVDLRDAGHRSEFALHSCTVELDSRTALTNLDVRVEREPVACERCGTMLFESASGMR